MTEASITIETELGLHMRAAGKFAKLAGRFRSRVEYPAYFFSPGEYSVTFGGYNADDRRWTWAKDQLRFVILEEWHPDYDTNSKMGLVNLPLFGERIQESEEDL